MCAGMVGALHVRGCLTSSGYASRGKLVRTPRPLIAMRARSYARAAASSDAYEYPMRILRPCLCSCAVHHIVPCSLLPLSDTPRKRLVLPSCYHNCTR